MYKVSIKESFTGYLFQKSDIAFSIGTEDSKLKKFVKLSTGTAAFASLAIIGLVESVVRNILMTLVKSIQFMIPKKSSLLHPFNRNVFYPLTHHAESTANAALQSLGRVFTSFLTSESREGTTKAINQQVATLYDSKLAHHFYNIHINGVS